MGLIEWILNHEQSYENGSEWAETLISVDADVSPGQVERMAEDLSGHPGAFYAGFADVWNEQPEIEKPRPFWKIW